MLAILAASVLLDGHQLKPITYPDLQKAIFESYRELESYSFRYQMIRTSGGQGQRGVFAVRVKGEHTFFSIELGGEMAMSASSTGPDSIIVVHSTRTAYVASYPDFEPRQEQEYKVKKVDGFTFAIDQSAPRISFATDPQWVSAKKIEIDKRKLIEVEYIYRSEITESDFRVRIWFTDGHWIVYRFLMEGEVDGTSAKITISPLTFEPKAVLTDEDLEIPKSAYEGYKIVKVPPPVRHRMAHTWYSDEIRPS